jgi:hypothetical protein
VLPIRAHRARAALLGLGVDVVAEADDEVEVVVGHDLVGVVEAVREVLAGPEREAHGLARVLGQGRPEAADGAVGRARGEAVEVLLVRAQPADARLQRVPAVARGRHAAAGDDAAEVHVARDLELRADAARDVVQARPQRDPARRRLARHHASENRPPRASGAARPCPSASGARTPAAAAVPAAATNWRRLHSRAPP